MLTPIPGTLGPMRPRGPQCMVDWRYVKGGFVGWYAGDERIGVWEPAPANTHGEPFGKVGWAVWPAERLCALEAEEVGEFATPELFLAGGELRLNVKTREAGALWVELRDASGQAIPGHSSADADPISGDHLSTRATWHGAASLGELTQQPLSLAFRLRMASLFAFEGL